MRHLLPLSPDQFGRARTRRVTPREQRLRATAPVGTAARLRAIRTNPQLLAVTASHSPVERLAIHMHNWATRRRWRRELQALDDRQLRDVGLSRLDIARVVRQRPGFWV